jgi:hypothetical protein
MALSENEAVQPYTGVMMAVIMQLRASLDPNQLAWVDALSRDWLKELQESKAIQYTDKDDVALSASGILEIDEMLQNIPDDPMEQERPQGAPVPYTPDESGRTNKRKRSESGLDGGAGFDDGAGSEEEDEDEDLQSEIVTGLSRRLLESEGADLLRLNEIIGARQAPATSSTEDKVSEVSKPSLPAHPTRPVSSAAPRVQQPPSKGSNPQKAGGGLFGGTKKTAVSTPAAAKPNAPTAVSATPLEAVKYADTKSPATPTTDASPNSGPPAKKPRGGDEMEDKDTNKEKNKEICSDDSDGEDVEVKPRHIVYCLAEDITRKGALWKWDLSQGVMHIFDRDWVFRRARGQGKW